VLLLAACVGLISTRVATEPPDRPEQGEMLLTVSLLRSGGERVVGAIRVASGELETTGVESLGSEIIATTGDERDEREGAGGG
jgi:hypothetical protein